MSLPGGEHIRLGGLAFMLDEDYEQKTGRRCYTHGGRSQFAGRTDITGKPGSQNLKPDYLVWAPTRFDGEGQVVLDPSDQESANLFYRSEGLNFRVAGQASLNKALLSETVSTTSATTTWQGAADFADVGSPAVASTTTNTDRKINGTGATNGKIQGTSSLAGGAAGSNVQMDFYLYVAPFSDGATTIQGNAFNKVDGSPQDSGTDKIITRGDIIRSTKISSGSEVTAGETTRVELYASLSSIRGQFIRFQIIDVTFEYEDVVTGGVFSLETTSGTPFAAIDFVPKANRDYKVQIAVPSSIEPTPVQTTIDKILYGPEVSTDTATIEVYNFSDSATLSSSVVDVTNQATGGSEPGTLTASISFAAGNKNYRPRVTRTSGKQKIWVDKVIARKLSATAWVIDAMELGLGSQSSGVFTPKIWAVANDSAASADNIAFAYNPSTDVWDSVATLDTATGVGLTCYGLAHSDAAEYGLFSSNEVLSWTAAGVDTLRATNIPAGVGIAYAQDRLWVLSEGSAGTTVYACTPETVLGNITSASTDIRSVVINAKAKTPDLSLRQRMCGAPTGARFFINYGDITCKVYEVDSSGSTLAPRELADLGAGIKGTCITHSQGITYIGAQFYGDSTASDTDKKPRSVLFAIDQNGVLQLVEFMREDSPDVRPPEALFAYQTDLYILQGNYVWRHDLRGGGLYLEYELTPATPANQRGLAVLFGRIFAAYTTEIFVAGSLGTYRRSSASGGNTYTSSIFDFGLPSVKKSLAKFEVVADTMPSNTQIALEYQIDQSGTWVSAGQMTAGREQTFYIIGVAFLTLQIRMRLSSSDGVSTPVWKGTTIWCSAAQDEEYFDLVALTEDQDSSFRVANEQVPGVEKSSALMTLWRGKEVTTFTDGYGSAFPAGEDYLVTIEDIRVEETATGEGRTVMTLRVVR